MFFLHELVHAFEIALLQARHAAARFLLHENVGNLVVLEDPRQVVRDLRLVVVHEAGGEEGDLAGSALAVSHGELGTRARVRAEGLRAVFREPRIAVHAHHLLAHGSQRLGRRCRVHRMHHDRNRRELAVAVGGGELAIAKVVRRAFAVLLRLVAQHQVREVDVPRVRRHVRTLDHVAHVAEVALVDDVLEARARHLLELALRRRVDQVEKRRKGVAQAHAPPASVADLEDPLFLGDDLRRVEKLRVLPVERVAGRGFEVAFGHKFGDRPLVPLRGTSGLSPGFGC
jgi:hypothetical protein